MMRVKDFQRAAKKVGQDKDGWDAIGKMGKCCFLARKEIAARLAATPAKSLIALNKRVPAYQPIDSVAYLGEKTYFYASHAE